MLPIFQDTNKNFMLLQTNWAKDLNPVIKNTILNGLQLTNVALISGATTINHLLGRMQIGWFITDLNAVATIYRSQPLNAQTLTLTSSAAATVSIWVY